MKGRRKKRDTQWERVLRYREEARRMASSPSANQQQFFHAASRQGSLLEPTGPMAGPRMDRAHKSGPTAVETDQRPLTSPSSFSPRPY